MNVTCARIATLIGLSIIPIAATGCGTPSRSMADDRPKLFTSNPNLLENPDLSSQRLSLAGGDQLGSGIGKVQAAQERLAVKQYAAELLSPLE